MARIEATRARMAGLLRRWQRSGETAAAFCRRHGIKPQRLSYWKRVLGLARPTVPRRAGRGGGGFVPVSLVDAGGGATLEIQLTSGDRLVLHEGSSLELLRRAVAVLRERC
jgi:hypothetical protein